MRLREGLIGEEIDGEVVMIDMATGRYYSLRGGSVEAWRMLRDGTSRVGLTSVLAATFDAEASVIETALDGLLSFLGEDGLLIEDPDGAPAVASELPDQQRPFEAFEAERFDDMAHVIQLDPVHDVDPERGWPLALD